VEKMAVNMNYMQKSLEKQSKDIEEIKSIPSSRWDKVISGIIGAIAAAIGGGIIFALAR
jgi:putative sterol carrier protein